MSEDASSHSSSFRNPFRNTRATSVTIAESDFSPTISPLEQTHISNLANRTKRHRTSLNKRLAGRASISPAASPEITPRQPDGQDGPVSNPARQGSKDSSSFNAPQSLEEVHGQLLSQLSQWIQHEKQKRKKPVLDKPITSSPSALSALELDPPSIPIRGSDAGRESDADTALEKLEKILADSSHLSHQLLGRLSGEIHHYTSRRRSSIKSRFRRLSHTAGSSDTDYIDGDALVPAVDTILDNTKTLGFLGGAAESAQDLTRTVSRSVKEGNWFQFKNEIIRLTHTLRLKGWRQVPLGNGSEIDVQRLSGALTNAVYVVTPPDYLAKHNLLDNDVSNQQPEVLPKRRPKKLLLRIYGPQVEHLIDRDAELQILKRLARKNIGPRLLGTFQNGRFEEYLHAKTLTPHDIKTPDTYKQIAKRMRELHDGIELLDQERAAGPFVWQNWDKWVARCGEIINCLDQQSLVGEGAPKLGGKWNENGLVCGVEWAKFRKAVEMYRKWLTKQYGGERRIRDQLVFAHNDTQYGNLLRLEPSGESPLLLPANEHRQLVVIDFEYANANTPGLEFANHFTEWCYNYHSPTQPHACNVSFYPHPKDQRAFLQAYVQHTPRHSTPPSPALPFLRKSNSSISAFMLDSRGPPNQYDAEEAARDESVNREVERLMKETRLWRVANSAMWVAWGIVQAKIPGLDELLATQQREKQESAERASAGKEAATHESDPSSAKFPTTPRHASIEEVEDDPEVELEEEFDYLAYAQERAFFFWGDLLELGLIKEDDLPESVLGQAKRVAY